MSQWRLCMFVLLYGVASHAWSEDVTGDARARIDAIRHQNTLELDAEDAACFSKFAVTDCQNKIVTRRRKMLAELKRQEGALNAVERRQKGLEQLQKSKNKAAENAQRELDTQAGTDKTTEADRQKTLDGKVLSHREQAKAETRKSKQPTSTSALDDATVQKNRAAYQDKMKELEKRREDRDKRMQEHGPSSLPLPPTLP
jgi:colicin import membrane protein